MLLGDYHVHSVFSDDGHDTIQEICRQAVEAGLTEVALTDHLDIRQKEPFAARLDWKERDRVIREVQQLYKGRLTLRRGIELGEPQLDPDRGKQFMEKDDLDFTIGSVHLFEGDDDLAFYNYEHYTQEMAHAVYSRYLDSLIQLAQWEGHFDVMGHLTYPLRYMARWLPPLDLTRYRERFVHLFDLLLEQGRGIEVNTSGLRQAIGETFPPLSLLHLYRERGGEVVTVGSDAHVARQVGSHVLEGQELLKTAGFRYVAAFEGHRPVFYSL